MHIIILEWRRFFCLRLKMFINFIKKPIVSPAMKIPLNKTFCFLCIKLCYVSCKEKFILRFIKIFADINGII